MSLTPSEVEAVAACETCRFAHHWEETRRRFVRAPLSWWQFLASSGEDGAYESYEAKGVQCTRYPETLDVEDDHWCGEYQSKDNPNG